MLTKKLRFSSLSLALAALTLVSSAEAKKKKAEPPAEEVTLEEDSGSSKKKSKGKDDSKAKEEEEKPPEEAPPADEEQPSEAASDEGEKQDDAPADAAPSDDDKKSPIELPGKSYYFVGARFRGLVIPTFIIEAFGDGGKAVFGPNFGPEFGIRRDGFEYNFAITYTAYPMGLTPFKAPSDPEAAMELVESHIKVLYFSADFLWSHAFSPQVQLLYGGGAGLGFVWGDLFRTEAYKDAAGNWQKCQGPNNPAVIAADRTTPYCSVADNDPPHYANYTEASWAGGGSKPLVFPWLALQTGLRFKPSHQFAARLEVGIGFGQVWFGLGADYGL